MKKIGSFLSLVWLLSSVVLGAQNIDNSILVNKYEYKTYSIINNIVGKKLQYR